MKTLSSKIWTYQFSDAKNSLWVIPFAHTLAAIIFIGAGIFTARLGLNIFIPIFFAMAFYFVDLKNVKSVHVISMIYFLLCFFELLFIGVPEIPFVGGRQIAKGAFLEILIHMAPWVYLGLKFALGIVLIRFVSILKSKPIK